MLVEELRRIGHQVPAVVERELDGFLTCGVLAHGFARVRCGACGHELLVPFSCKRRGICPSCTARRAEDTAAHLVDHVLPRVPYRQWVFTFPIPVGLALSRRPQLITATLRTCLRVLFSWQRRRLRRRGLRQLTCGAITFVQRFGSALQLNVHFHVLVPDGAFDDDVFVADEPPDDADVRAILLRAGRRVIALPALLKRVFAVDVMVCARCEGPMRVIACLEEPAVVARNFRHLGLSAKPLPTARAQAPAITLELFTDQ